MPFDPKEFLAMAKRLVDDTDYAEESAFRTCISRAYYSAFLLCRTFLENKHGFNFPRRADAHRLVVSRLRQRKVIKSLPGPYGERFIVADSLKTLRESGRNSADYDISSSIDQSSAQAWIQLADYIVNRIP
jgi:uncharacterized protein (UPF0332 family)